MNRSIDLVGVICYTVSVSVDASLGQKNNLVDVGGIHFVASIALEEWWTVHM